MAPAGNFNGSGKWDVWDGVNGWTPTQVACTQFPANQWIHLVWDYQRVGNQVHYISVTVRLRGGRASRQAGFCEPGSAGASPSRSIGNPTVTKIYATYGGGRRNMTHGKMPT